MPARLAILTPGARFSSSERAGNLKPAVPLCSIAAENRPRASGLSISKPTFWPPADCPAMVTRAGSPPNCAMLSRTHCSLAI